MLQSLQENPEQVRVKPIISVFIEWKARPDGIKPMNSTISNSEAKEKCPGLLIDFYESRISLQFNASSAK